MQASNQKNSQIYHPFLLSYFDHQIENSFHLKTDEIRLRLPNIILVSLSYFFLVILRFASMMDSLKMNKISHNVLEIIWFVLTFVNASLELSFHFFSICCKIKAIPTIISTSYILGHSCYINY